MLAICTDTFYFIINNKNLSDNMSLMASIRDEIRKVMAIHGLFKLYRKPQMTQKSIFQFLEGMFHGNDKAGIVLQITQDINGLAPYNNRLYTNQTNIVTNSNVSNTSSVTSLVLKKELCQSESVIIAGRDITNSILENTTKTTKELVKG
jgi:hypothetical protein